MVIIGFIFKYNPTNNIFSMKIKLYLISIKYLATEMESLFPVIVICRSSFSPFSWVPSPLAMCTKAPLICLNKIHVYNEIFVYYLIVTSY